MQNPNTGENMAISWIIYPYDMILEESAFYNESYSIEGLVFSDDGAGNPYYIKSDGKIYFYEVAYDEESFMANSLVAFGKRVYDVETIEDDI